MSDDPTRRPLLDVQVTPGVQATVTLHGDLDPHTAPLLEDALEGVSGDGTERVVIDLAAITFIDSSGLRAFVAARESLSGRGIDLALRNPSANTRRLLDITGLGEIITVE